MHVYNHILAFTKLATYSASVLKSNVGNFEGPRYATAFSVGLFMEALWNRAGHYIFAMWFLSSSSSFFFFPRLISAVADWMSTIYTSTHGVVLERI